MVKVGLIGCGKVAQRHIEAYQEIYDVQVCVVDAIEERARAFAAKYDVEYKQSLEKLIGDPDVNVCDICVPTPRHKEVILAALRNGKHTFSEKPLCETLGDAHEIYEAAERARCMVGVGYPLRFYPALTFAKTLLEQGVLGKPHLALLRIGGRGSAAIWKHKQDQGGGATSEMLVHLLDLAVWLFGTMEHATVLFEDTLLQHRFVEGQLIDADAEDLVLVRLSQNGTTVICESDLCTPGYMQTMEVQGENGSLFTSLLDYMPTVLFCKEPAGEYSAGISRFQFKESNVFVSELRQFIERVKQPDGWNDIINSLNVARLFEEVKSQRRSRVLS